MDGSVITPKALQSSCRAGMMTGSELANDAFEVTETVTTRVALRRPFILKVFLFAKTDPSCAALLDVSLWTAEGAVNVATET